MIKIEHPNLEQLALRHYQSIENALTNAQKKNQLAVQNKRIKDIFGNAHSFQSIVLSTPEQMEELIDVWDEKNCNQFKYYVSTLYDEFSSGKRLRTNKQGSQETSYNALTLVDELGIRVCPYCNRNFIYNTDHTGRRTCDIDHFFPKNKFPFLAISFFNLIPSCKVCNLIKLDKWNTDPSNFLINPYDERFSFDADFRVEILNSKFYYDTKAINVEFSMSKFKRTQNHIKAFHLDTLYENHDDYALELIQKKYAYSEAYIDNLFSKYEGSLFKRRSDLLRFLTSNFLDNDDLSKRPLSKLTKDIIGQLDL